MNAPLTVDVVSDIVCPWCFIGKHRLEAALAELHGENPEQPIRVQWLPFFLDPNTPEAGEPYRAFLEKKFGGAAKVDEIQQRLAEAGATAGIEFAFEKMQVRPNTLRAHRLIHRMQQKGDAGPLKERLMSGHFQRGENVGDIATLARIAGEFGEFGEPENETADFLRSDQDTDVVFELAARAQQMGVNGVPFFIFNQKVGMSGAHPPENILQAIAQASR
jgi:predicted DsbA family dithiol-disulfide isomerase